jgi:WD40 repeat protein
MKTRFVFHPQMTQMDADKDDRNPRHRRPRIRGFLCLYLWLSLFICGFILAAGLPAAAQGSNGAPELVLNIDHVGEITAVAVAPDSRTIASGSRDRSVKLWDAASGKLLRTLSGHRDAVLSVTFAANGATLYSGSRDGTVRAWEVANGRLVGTFNAGPPLTAGGSVNAIAALPVKGADGIATLLMARAVGPANVVQLGRVGGAPGEAIPPLAGHLKTVRVLGFSPDGKLLASGSDDGAVKLWDAEDGSLQRTLKGYAMPVTTIAFSADSTQMLTGSEDGIAKVWDLASGKERQELQMNRPGDGVFAVAFAPDGVTAVTGGHGGRTGRDFLMVWNAAAGKLVRTAAGHEAPVTAVAFAPDGRTFVSGARDNTLRVWDTQGGEPRAVGTSERVADVACDPTGGMLASAGADGTVRLWDAHTGALLRALTGHTGRVLSVAFAPDGQTLASGGVDKSVHLWNPRTGAAGLTLAGASGPVNALTFTPDGGTLVGGTGASVADGTVTLWDARTGALRQSLSEQSLGMVHAVAVSPDGTLIATGSNAWNGGAVRVWDAVTGKLLLREATRTVRAVAFSPDGKQLATGSATTNEEGEPTGEEIRIWNARTRELQRTLIAPEEGGGAWALTYANNATLVSGGRGGTLRVWNARTGEMTQTLAGHIGAVLSLTVAAPKPAGPGPALVASGGLDNTVRLWRLGGGAAKLLATLVTVPPPAPGADGWIALAPEGFYDSAPGAERLIAWSVGGSLFPVAAFEQTFHRPELVRRALQGEVLPETGEVEAFARGAAVPPQLQFQAPRDGQDIAGAKQVRVELTVTDERRVTRVEVFANGRPVQAKPLEVAAKPLEVAAKPLEVAAKPLEVAAKPLEVAAKPLEVAAKPLEVAAKPLEVAAKPLEVAAKPLEVAAKPLEVAAKPIPLSHKILQQFQIDVPLPADDALVTLTALAYNEQSLQSRDEIRLTRGGAATLPVGPRGTLFVLAVGVSQYRDPKHNLKYAASDAEAFANLWQQQNGSALYQSVSVTRLTDAEATAPRVRAALFQILERATESDTVAIFLSGHGVQVGDAQYYFATHEIDPSSRARVAETALPWTVLQTTLAAVKARRVLLFLDACHSGNSLGVQQAENERMAELLVKRAGVMVFASSRGSEYSYELDEAKQGAFTSALVEAIRDGKADLEIGGRRDGIVTAEELLVYLRARVPQLTEGRQTPSCPLLRDFGEAYPVARLR